MEQRPYWKGFNPARLPKDHQEQLLITEKRFYRDSKLNDERAFKRCEKELGISKSDCGDMLNENFIVTHKRLGFSDREISKRKDYYNRQHDEYVNRMER